MFEQMMAAMSQPATANPLGYAQQMMSSTMRLSRSQAEVMKQLYDEVGQEFQATMTSSDPTTMMKNWPHLLTTATQANAQAAALLMKNAKEFQNELMQIMQVPASGLPGQIMKNMMEIVTTPTAAAAGADGRAARTKKSA